MNGNTGIPQNETPDPFYDYAKLPAMGSVNRTEADSLFRLFDEGTDFELDPDDDDGHTWIYKGTLRYGQIINKKTGKLDKEQHRIAHVLHHSIDHVGRTDPHGVFTVPKTQVFDLLHDVRSLGTPVGKDFEHTFGSIIGKANNTPKRCQAFRETKRMLVL